MRLKEIRGDVRDTVLKNIDWRDRPHLTKDPILISAAEGQERGDQRVVTRGRIREESGSINKRATWRMASMFINAKPSLPQSHQDDSALYSRPPCIEVLYTLSNSNLPSLVIDTPFHLSSALGFFDAVSTELPFD